MIEAAPPVQNGSPHLTKAWGAGHCSSGRAGKRRSTFWAFDEGYLRSPRRSRYYRRWTNPLRGSTWGIVLRPSSGCSRSPCAAASVRRHTGRRVLQFRCDWMKSQDRCPMIGKPRQLPSFKGHSHFGVGCRPHGERKGAAALGSGPRWLSRQGTPRPAREAPLTPPAPSACPAARWRCRGRCTGSRSPAACTAHTAAIPTGPWRAARPARCR